MKKTSKAVRTNLLLHWKMYLSCMLLALLTSCIVPNIANCTYVSNQNNDTYLIFHEDSTFEYKRKRPYANAESSFGKFCVIGRDIYLNSYNKTRLLGVCYSSRKGEGSGNIVITVKYDVKNEDICYYSIPCINDEDSKSWTFCNAYTFESEVPIQSLSFNINREADLTTRMLFSSINTQTIYPIVNMGDTLDICIKVVDSLFFYRVFNHTPLKLKNKRIFLDGLSFKKT